MVNDHRTNIKIGNAQAVLDGDLDELIHAYLLHRAAAS
jgi:peptide chain release factor 2